MIIDIVGGGSLGLLYGGKLLASGGQVRFWTRTTEQAELLRSEGITITEKNENTHIKPDQIHAKSTDELTETLEKVPGACLMLMVKQTAMNDVIHQFRNLKNHSLKMVCFQNGIGHMEKLRAALPKALLFSAITTEGAKRELSHVFRAGSGETWMGLERSVKNGGDSELQDEQSINTLVQQLRYAGFDCTVSNEIDTLIYRKLLINAVINPLTAIWRIPNGDLIKRQDRILIMRQLYEEAWAVYGIMGMQMEDHLWEQIIEVCRSTASNTSSMLADVLHQRRTEVESITGQIVGLARKFNLAAPTHEMLLHLVIGM